MKNQTFVLLSVFACFVLVSSSGVLAIKPTDDKGPKATKLSAAQATNDNAATTAPTKSSTATAGGTRTSVPVKNASASSRTSRQEAPSTVSEPMMPVTDFPPETPVPSATDAAAAYSIPWQSINAGGAQASSPSYTVNGSVGQSIIGFSTSTNYQAGIGYWYGAGGGCSCPFQADMNGDGFIDSVDLSIQIDVVFFGATDPQDPGCPTTRGDFNNDGFADSVDLSLVIDHVFFGGPGPASPC